MSQLAIDIVLLPPSDIMDQAIAINKQFPNDPIQLNKTDCLPHISLCMGVAQEEDLAKIEEIINETIREFSPLSLTIENINKQYSSFYIKHNEQLQRLHEKIMENFAAYLSYDADTTMFYSPPTVVEKTLYWVTTYKETSSRDKYHPHITL
jgi:2'-5' RNA ligase